MAGAHFGPGELEAIKAAAQKSLDQFLEAAGIIVEGQAKLLTPVDTGLLRSSINYQVQGKTCKIGTNVHYAPHVEFGTVRMKAQPYLRPALQNNEDKLKQLAKEIWASNMP